MLSKSFDFFWCERPDLNRHEVFPVGFFHHNIVLIAYEPDPVAASIPA